MANPQPLSIPEALRRLRLFNEMSEKLQRRTFLNRAFSEGAGVTAHFEPGRFRVEKHGADEESTAAFLLTLRMFLQEKDGIELEQIERLYASLDLPEQQKQGVSDAMKTVNEFLDGPTEIALNGNAITNRMVLETYLYGDHAHANADKRVALQVWKSGPLSLILESQFEYVVGELLRCISWLANMNENAIRTLEVTIP
jgi:hypothetical protein